MSKFVLNRKSGTSKSPTFHMQKVIGNAKTLTLINY
jgi:hypothetical protein